MQRIILGQLILSHDFWESSERPNWKLWLPEAKPSQWSLPRGVGWVGQIIDQRISPHSQHMVIGHLCATQQQWQCSETIFHIRQRSKQACWCYLCWENALCPSNLHYTLLTFNCIALCCDFQYYCTVLTITHCADFQLQGFVLWLSIVLHCAD